MHHDTFKPKAYLKEGCPYSFKYLLFMTEAGLLDQIDVVRCDPESAEFDTVKQKLSKRRHATPPFRPSRSRRNVICRTPIS